MARLGLRARHSDPALVPAALARSLRSARLSDLAAATEGLTDLEAAVETLLTVLGYTPDPVLVVVDDAHFLQGAGAEFLERLVEGTPAPHRLMVLGRSIPETLGGPGLESEVSRLSPEDLRFEAEEVEQLMSRMFGFGLSDSAVETVVRATGGWPAAVALWARALDSEDDPEAAVGRLAAQRAGLGTLVERLIGALGPEKAAMSCQLAHLPLLSPEAVAEVSGMPDMYREMEEAGLPFVESRPGWSRFADPVARHLAAKQPFDPAIARRGAEAYEKRGEDSAAISTLLAGGLAREAAKLIAGLSTECRDAVGGAEIRAAVEQIPDSVLKDRPEAWLQVARACDTDGRWAERARALERAEHAVCSQSGHDRQALLREIRAERAYDDLREGRPDEAGQVAESVLLDSGDGEHMARSRALVCIGRLRTLNAGSDEAFEAATDLFTEAAAAARRAGDDHWTFAVLLRSSEDVYRERCMYNEALAAVDEALRYIGTHTRGRALALISRCDSLIELGRTDEAEANLSESAEFGSRLHDTGLIAYSSWSEMELAVQLDDRRRLLAAIERCEQNRGDWFSGFSGVGFLTDAADALDRVGLRAAALRYLEQARLASAAG